MSDPVSYEVVPEVPKSVASTGPRGSKYDEVIKVAQSQPNHWVKVPGLVSDYFYKAEGQFLVRTRTEGTRADGKPQVYTYGASVERGGENWDTFVDQLSVKEKTKLNISA